MLFYVLLGGLVKKSRYYNRSFGLCSRTEELLRKLTVATLVFMHPQILIIQFAKLRPLMVFLFIHGRLARGGRMEIKGTGGIIRRSRVL
jgi:hypothetical protein